MTIIIMSGSDASGSGKQDAEALLQTHNDRVIVCLRNGRCQRKVSSGGTLAFRYAPSFFILANSWDDSENLGEIRPGKVDRSPFVIALCKVRKRKV